MNCNTSARTFCALSLSKYTFLDGLNFINNTCKYAELCNFHIVSEKQTNIAFLRYSGPRDINTEIYYRNIYAANNKINFNIGFTATGTVKLVAIEDSVFVNESNIHSLFILIRYKFRYVLPLNKQCFVIPNKERYI